MTVRSHFAVVMVMLTGVGGGLLLLVAMRPPVFTGDEQGELQGDDGDAPEETAGPRTGDDIESCFLCSNISTSQRSVFNKTKPVEIKMRGREQRESYETVQIPGVSSIFIQAR